MTAEFDFRQQGEQIWTIEAETEEGSLVLSEGGAKLAIDGVPLATAGGDAAALVGEYPRRYTRMASLVRRGAVDMDMAPLVLVADAFLLGRRLTVEPYIE